MKKYLAFDIGGTDLKYGILTNNFDIIYKNKVPTEALLGGMHIINNIIKIGKELLKTHIVVGVAVSSGGTIDWINGTVVSASDSIPNFVGLELKKLLEDAFKLPVSVENDVNCAALCENTLGVSKHAKNVATLTIGTGIGGALIFNNELYRGHAFSAGEWGYMNILGSRYESIAATKALVEKSQVNIGSFIKNGIDVFSLYDNHDTKASILVAEFYNNLSIGIANIIYCFNPEIVVLGGGITSRPTFILELMPYIEKNLNEYMLKNTRIVAAQFKNDAGLLGALVHHIRCFSIR